MSQIKHMLPAGLTEDPPSIERLVTVFATVPGSKPDIMTGEMPTLILDAPGLSEALPLGTTLNIACPAGRFLLVEHYVTITESSHITTEVRPERVMISVQLHGVLTRVYAAAGLDKSFPCDDGKPVYVQ